MVGMRACTASRRSSVVNSSASVGTSLGTLGGTGRPDLKDCWARFRDSDAANQVTDIDPRPIGIQNWQ
jgi:hypothetical protein